MQKTIYPELTDLEIADLFTGGVAQMWRKPFILVNVLTWLLIFCSASLILSGVFPIKDSLALASFNIGFLVFTYHLNLYLIDRVLERKRYLLYFLLFAILFSSIVGIRVYFNLYYIHHVLPGTLSIKENWVYLFSIITTLIVLVISFFNGLLMNRSQREDEYRQIIVRQKEAQVEFLKAQMSPHFLFNTLNNIYALTIDATSPASEMILLLSDILRYAVYETRQSKVLLNTEVEQIRNLLRLYQLKSENILPITLTVDVSSASVYIEPMILIPLVENCFKHCNLETNPKAYIAISLKEKGGKIIFETENSREEVKKANLEPGGIGLKNIRERLAIRYVDGHSLAVKEDEDSYYVRLEIYGDHE